MLVYDDLITSTCTEEGSTHASRYFDTRVTNVMFVLDLHVACALDDPGWISAGTCALDDLGARVIHCMTSLLHIDDCLHVCREVSATILVCHYTMHSRLSLYNAF